MIGDPKTKEYIISNRIIIWVIEKQTDRYFLWIINVSYPNTPSLIHGLDIHI